MGALCQGRPAVRKALTHTSLKRNKDRAGWRAATHSLLQPI